MVTNIKEGKTKKCEQYWPAESRNGQSYGPFNVTVLEQHIFADYTIRTILRWPRRAIPYSILSKLHLVDLHFINFAIW